MLWHHCWSTPGPYTYDICIYSQELNKFPLFLDGVPTEFNSQIIRISDDFIDSKPVTELKNTTQSVINLKDYWYPQDQYYLQWRLRIEEIRAILLDQNENLVPSNGRDNIQIEITFPTLFNDIDFFKNIHTFVGQNFFCRPTYYTKPGT